MLTTSLFASLILLPVVDSFIHAKPQYLMDFSVSGQEQTPRELNIYTYSGGPVADLVAPTKTCVAVGGLGFECGLYQRVGTPEDYLSINITVNCALDTTTGYDYRRAKGCNCWALLVPSDPNRLSKECPCFPCPQGFGQSSISIDCTYLIDDGNSTSSPSPGPAPETTVAPVSAPSASVITAAPVTTGVSSTVTIAQATPTAPVAPSTSPVATTTSPTSAPTVVQGTTTAPVGTTTSAPTTTATIGQGTSTPSTAPQTGTPSLAPVAAQTLSPSSAPTRNATNVTKPDPYIFSTCTSVDCQGNCNGTCSLGCDTAGAVCPFCQARTPQPTGARGPSSLTLTSESASLTGIMSALLAATALMMI